MQNLELTHKPHTPGLGSESGSQSAIPMVLWMHFFLHGSQSSGHVVGASGFLTNREKGSLCQRFCRPDVESQQFRHSVNSPDVQWAPREANSEVGLLAEGCADGFDPSLSVRVCARRRTGHG